MHVDFVSPDPFDGVPPVLLNLSADPDGFKTTYENATSDDNPHSESHKTSWSWGAQETFGVKATVGDPEDASGYSVGDKFTAAQNLKGSIDHSTSTFMGHDFGLSATSSLHDVVTHNDTNLRIWVYPVIGQTVCPAGKQCPPDQKVPLTIQFSAPTTDNDPITEDGKSLSWYQPPWEPGNILSYPANLDQLKSIYSGQGTCPGSTTGQNTTLCTLAEGNSFATDGAVITEKSTWTVTSATETDTSFTQDYSFENDLSVDGSIGTKAAGGVKFSADFDLTGSVGFSHPTTDSTKLGISTGLEVDKPGTFYKADQGGYQYYVTPYILGTTVPSGVVDNQPLDATVQTFGLVRGVFSVDPLANGAGSWWKQAYGQAPDVALNHPTRWTIVRTSVPGGNFPPNCLATTTNGGSSVNCAELSDREPDNPALSPYHSMRGFFISTTTRDPNTGLCVSASGQGPQLESAASGDCLYLQARVYNYSLKAMDPGTQVHVRFYFTPWDTTNDVPLGDSSLIQDVAAAQVIPPFDDTDVNNVAAPPNWILVPTIFDISQFDQTKNGNVSIRFWAVVWMQDGNGNLVGEMPAHGLTGIPGTLTSFADAAKLEECQSDGSCYSNNVGFFNQTFYISGTTLGAPAPLPNSSPSIDIGKLEVSAHQVTPRNSVVLSATLSASGGPASGVSVYFYDGDPDQGGRSFAVVRIPHIAEDSPYRVHALFQSNTCGVHQLFAVVNRGKSSEVVRRAHPVRVACSATQ